MPDTEFLEQLRSALPQLLRDSPEVRHELWGLMLEVFPSRQEFTQLLEELRAFREDSNQRFEAVDRRFEELREDMNRRFEAVDRRFEAVDRRFEAVDRRFEAVIQELREHGGQLREHARGLRELQLHMSSLGSRVGHGLERIIKEIVEEFAGQSFPFAERLVLRDEAGEVFGVPRAEVEFDLYAHNGTAYLVEVKSHIKATEVFAFYRKVKFAEQKLERAVIPLILALSAGANAEQRMDELGIRYRIGFKA